MARSAYLIAALTLAMTTSSVRAGVFHVSTSEGRPVEIFGHAYWNHNCAGGPSPIATVSPPSHGALSTRSKTIRITGAETGSANCVGREIIGNMFVYTPEKGFHGSDHFSYTSTVITTGVVLTHQVTVDVR
jgi:hypothetical protein